MVLSLMTIRKVKGRKFEDDGFHSGKVELLGGEEQGH